MPIPNGTYSAVCTDSLLKEGWRGLYDGLIDRLWPHTPPLQMYQSCPNSNPPSQRCATHYRWCGGETATNRVPQRHGQLFRKICTKSQTRWGYVFDLTHCVAPTPRNTSATQERKKKKKKTCALIFCEGEWETFHWNLTVGLYLRKDTAELKWLFMNFFQFLIAGQKVKSNNMTFSKRFHWWKKRKKNTSRNSLYCFGCSMITHKWRKTHHTEINCFSMFFNSPLCVCTL